MDSAKRLALALLITLGTMLAASSGSAADPLPGTCGLPGTEDSTFAFMNPAKLNSVPGIPDNVMACQAGTTDMAFVRGCGADYYTTHRDHGTLNLTLTQSGFHLPHGAGRTLLDVIEQPGPDPADTYLQQAVTAYLNSLYVEGYAYDVEEVLDGYHSGSITEGSFAWNNHGAPTTQFVVPTCPLSATGGGND